MIDQGAALRLVVLVDRLYDRDVLVLTSGAGFDQWPCQPDLAPR